MPTYEKLIENLHSLLRDAMNGVFENGEETVMHVREAIVIAAPHYGKTVEQVAYDVWNF